MSTPLAVVSYWHHQPADLERYIPLSRAELAYIAKAHIFQTQLGVALLRVDAYASSVHDLYCCSRQLSIFPRKMIDQAREARLTINMPILPGA